VLRVGDGLALRRATHEALAVFLERHDRRRRARAFGVRDDHGLASFHHRDDGVRGAQVDADNLAHCIYVSFVRKSSCDVGARSPRTVPLPYSGHIVRHLPDLSRSSPAQSAATGDFRLQL
jgi:hypothetical protein